MFHVFARIYANNKLLCISVFDRLLFESDYFIVLHLLESCYVYIKSKFKGICYLITYNNTMFKDNIINLLRIKVLNVKYHVFFCFI